MAPLGSCRLYPTELSLLVELRAGKRLKKPFGSGVFCSLPDPCFMSFEERLQLQSGTRTRVSKQVTGGKKTAKPAVKQQRNKKG